MSHSLSRRALLLGGLTAVGGSVAAGALSAAEGDAAASKSASALTIDTLGNLLGALGLKPTKTESRFDFQFSAKHGEEWNLSMSVVLSTDEKTIWLMAWLDELPQSAADVPRTALLRLLADNDKMGNGHFFAYVASNRRFVLQRVFKNEHITNASMKADILQLGATVVEQYPHWAVANWKQPAAGSSKESASREGKDLTSDDEARSSGSRPGSAPSSRAALKDASTGAPRTLRK